ncbi:hypothetical protein NGM37_27085, partial [Streptomyces sp. TRM76130]|nr:hypothetical protein [Streptomyces sp. TRM76130]
MALPLLVGAALISTAALLVWSFVSGIISKLGEYLPQVWDAFTTWAGSKVAGVVIALSAWGTAASTFFGSLWSKYIAGPVGRTWTSFINTVKALPTRTVVALATLGTQLASAASKHWQRFRDGTVNRVTSLISYIRGIPNR